MAVPFLGTGANGYSDREAHDAFIEACNEIIDKEEEENVDILDISLIVADHSKKKNQLKKISSDNEIMGIEFRCIKLIKNHESRAPRIIGRLKRCLDAMSFTNENEILFPTTTYKFPYDFVDDYIAQILQILNQAYTTNYIAQITSDECTSAGVGVILLNSLDYLAERKIVGRKTGVVYLYLGLGIDATEVRHVGNTVDLSQTGNYGPMVKIGKFAQRQIARHNLAENLARRRSEQIESGLCTEWQFNIGNALLHTLASPIIIHSILEDKRNFRNTEEVFTTHYLQSRDAVQLALKRHSDLLLDFGNGQTRYLRSNSHRYIGNIGIGINSQLTPRIHTQTREQYKHHQHQPPAVEQLFKSLIHRPTYLRKYHLVSSRFHLLQCLR